MSLISLERGSQNSSEITVASPAAGADFTLFTVPPGLRYRMETSFWLFATSAVVANRLPKLQLKDGSGNIVWEGGQLTTVPASGNFRYSGLRLGGVMQTSGSGVPIQFPLPDLWIPPSFVVAVSTSGIDVGDQYSAIRGMVTITSDAD